MSATAAVVVEKGDAGCVDGTAAVDEGAVAVGSVAAEGGGFSGDVAVSDDAALSRTRAAGFRSSGGLCCHAAKGVGAKEEAMLPDPAAQSCNPRASD